MSYDPETGPRFAGGVPQEPRAAAFLRRGETTVVILGVAAVFSRQGLGPSIENLYLEVGSIAIAAMGLIAASLAVRFLLSRTRKSFLRENRAVIAISFVWLLGMAAVSGGYFSLRYGDESSTRALDFVRWSDAVLCVRAMVEVILLTRRAAAGGVNPSVIVVATFLVLISLGAVLLALPVSRGPGAPADEGLADRARIALFTSTSASCVTGLVVVPTGGATPYWSRFGQVVIMGLIQIGGLGIMTMGAFFAVFSGRYMPIREHATLRDMLETERLGDVRRLVLSIAAFTFGSELIGALALSGLWPDLPPGERAFYSAFHAVSAFCNAGFVLTENSFVGESQRWQVFLGLPALIIVGGLGFGVLRNLADVTRGSLRSLRIALRPVWRRSAARDGSARRLTLTARLVTLTTLGLLIAGTAAYFWLERNGADGDDPLSKRVGDAWFQSVTFRTAGFNTVDHQRLQPGTKLFAIGLMFIGASPGSTGGGVKTTCFALAVLGMLSILRGRTRVEFAGRTIPDVLVHRAQTIVLLGLATVTAATLLLVVFEQNEGRFLDQMFEATSAFGTVGVSANLTPALSPSSHYVLIVTMFLGRVGPLTLLVATAGRMHDERYEFPVERVTLG